MTATVDPPSLVQFVTLSMLVHALVILLFGNVQSIGSGESESWWGPLDVTLRRLTPEVGSGARLAPGADRGEADRSLLRRPEARRETPREQAPARAEPAPEPPAPVEALPRLNLEAPEEADRAVIPQAAPIERIAPRTLEREAVPPIQLPPREVPMAPSVPLERIERPKIEPQVAPTVELAPREVPALPAAPIRRIAPARIEQEVAPAVELPPREVLAPPSAPIERLAPSKVQPEVEPAVALPPRELPQAPSAPLDRIAPRNLDRDLALPAPVLAPVAPRAAPPVPAPAATPAAIPEQREVPTEEALPRLHLGAPQPDESMFKPRVEVVTPSSEPGGLPHIDREASRERAREIASGRAGTRGVFNPIPIPPEAKTKEAVAIEKAIRPDCRDAYAGLGLLAVPVLVASAIADAGCKW